MVEVLEYILFGLMFIALPIALVGVGVIAVLGFIEDIKFINKDKK
jgi:hypothetical protein